MRSTIRAGFLKVLHVNTMEHGGGAAQLVSDLIHAQRRVGHTVTLAVGREPSPHCGSTVIDHGRYRHFWARLSSYLLGRILGGNRLARCIGRPCNSMRVMLGHEDFDFPGSRRILDGLVEKPDVLHLHNLHGAYFDLRALPSLSRQVPTVVTLHDAWMLSGHCSHSFGCERWRTGCGHCPDLTIYPALRRDATAYNWRRKQRIYAQSRLHIVAPCRWLRDRLRDSILAPAVISSRIIPHGIDLSIFRPGDRREARKELELPVDLPILMFAAKGIRNNEAKDYQTLRKVLEVLGSQRWEKPLLFIALGEGSSPERFGNVELRFMPHLNDRHAVARYYQAADIYVHSAKAEAWGLTITEAMACGLPVVATNVGGIPDQVAEGQAGFLVPVADAGRMAERIEFLLEDEEARNEMGQNACKRAHAEYGLSSMASNYLDFYQSIMAHAKAVKT